MGLLSLYYQVLVRIFGWPIQKKMLFIFPFWQSTQPTFSVPCCPIFPHEYNKYMSSKASEILRALNSQIQHKPEPTNSPAPVTQ